MVDDCRLKIGTDDHSVYCRDIEAYLCRKNDGHLIRIVGPSFELVSGWEAAGVPLTIACRGIDRYFERYYRAGPRRRPVRIDFCDADVLDVFDEWRRALGLPAGGVVATVPAGEDSLGPDAPSRAAGRGSLPAHLERALLRLTNARATGALGAGADVLIDRLNRELDAARSAKGGVRGEARRALLQRLAALDVEVMSLAWGGLSTEEQQRLEAEAAAELASFRGAMTPDRYAHVLGIATRRRLREHAGLPTIELT